MNEMCVCVFVCETTTCIVSLWDLMRRVASCLIKGWRSHYPGRNHALQREFSRIIDDELRIPAGPQRGKHSCHSPLLRTSMQKSANGGNYTTTATRGSVRENEQERKMKRERERVKLRMRERVAS